MSDAAWVGGIFAANETEEPRLYVEVRCGACKARVDLWETQPVTERGADAYYRCYPRCGARESFRPVKRGRR